MQIVGSAYRHQVDDADMLHAVKHHLVVWQFDGYRMYCGPALDGSLLEVAINDREQIFHSMVCRPQFYPTGKR
ncbi:MAG: hypothetical protein GX596_01575 [Propionibacterium sp.]|nr:hypothetical protein [Propionibacterium sp.]